MGFESVQYSKMVMQRQRRINLTQLESPKPGIACPCTNIEATKNRLAGGLQDSIDR